MSVFLISWISRWLPNNTHRLRVLRLGFVANWLRSCYDKNTETLTTVLHGYPCLINGGNPYPFLIKAIPTFNQGLVQLVHQVAQEIQRKVNVADIGASIGNTVLLLQDKTGEKIAVIHCIEADQGFLGLLRHNMRIFSNVVIHETMLARAPGQIAALVRNHPGTATAIGTQHVTASTIDAELLTSMPCCDVLKIDIDGFDGEALIGAIELLRRDQPAVIFEWHPILTIQAGNDVASSFIALRSAGYERLLWFRNDGPFSHFSLTDDLEIGHWAQYLVRMQPHGDPHFDIIALPPRWRHLEDSIASLGNLQPSPAE